MIEFDDLDMYEEVESSNIKWVGSKGHHLIVAFHQGGVYAYPHMADEFQSLISAESVGKYFAREIKNKDYSRILSLDDVEEF